MINRSEAIARFYPGLQPEQISMYAITYIGNDANGEVPNGAENELQYLWLPTDPFARTNDLVSDAADMNYTVIDVEECTPEEIARQVDAD